MQSTSTVSINNKHQTSSLQLWPANSPDLNPVDY